MSTFMDPRHYCVSFCRAKLFNLQPDLLSTTENFAAPEQGMQPWTAKARPLLRQFMQPLPQHFIADSGARNNAVSSDSPLSRKA
jgi:hypothetical protein